MVYSSTIPQPRRMPTWDSTPSRTWKTRPIASICAPTTPAQHQEGEKSGEHPGAAAICGADDAADRFGLRKAFHPRTSNRPMRIMARLKPKRVSVVPMPPAKALAAFPEE